MHVCLHDSFGVNYACKFCYSSDEEKEVGRAQKCDAMTVRSDTEREKKDPHSPLATRKSCDIYKSENEPRSAMTRDARVRDYEPAVVEHPLLCTTSGIFLLLLLVDFGCL
jgi:hypothetical protein